MVEGQSIVESLDFGERIDKAAFLFSLIIQKPQLIRKVFFTDPFEKSSVFDEKMRRFSFEVVFEDDGTIKEALRNHIAEYETNLIKELDRIKQEKNKYE